MFLTKEAMMLLDLCRNTHTMRLKVAANRAKATANVLHMDVQCDYDGSTRSILSDSEYSCVDMFDEFNVNKMQSLEISDTDSIC